jgi:hypothetical protein
MRHLIVGLLSDEDSREVPDLPEVEME